MLDFQQAYVSPALACARLHRPELEDRGQERDREPLPPLGEGMIFQRRDEHDLSPRPLDPEHAAERNAVRLAGRKRRAGDQYANGGISFGFDGIQRNHRIRERDGFMTGRVA
jgi:hypothetical protein